MSSSIIGVSDVPEILLGFNVVILTVAKIMFKFELSFAGITIKAVINLL